MATDTIKSALNSAASTITSAVSGLPPAPAPDQYLRWDAPGVEVVGADEAGKAAQIADVMTRMQERNFAKHRQAFRATHVKVQGIVKGSLTVRAELPAHLRQGMFARPGATYGVAARYANEPYLLQPDQEPGPRGLSMKVFGVEGPRLDPEADADGTTQDWFFNNAPAIELTDIDTTLDIMSLREKHFDDPTGLGLKLKLRRDALKQHAPYQLPNTNVVSHAFFTQSAYRFGDNYGHLGLFPVLDAQTKRDEAVRASDAETALSDWLQDYFGGAEARYEMRIQLGTDPRHHPTEDGSVVWDEATAPYQTLATVTFPRQDSFSQPRRVFWEGEMSLSPWRGLEAHRPLGGINRLRKHVYARSASKRDEINVKKSHDVKSVDDIPD